MTIRPACCQIVISVLEMFLGSLEAVAGVIAMPPSEETRRTLTNALHYFAQGAPKHTADEEESLFPRLRRINEPEIQAALASLDALEDDHRRAEPLHTLVQRLSEQYLLTGKFTKAEIGEFRSSVASLGAMYRKHIRVEDESIFPLADRLLSNSEKAAIGQEMADRRIAPLL